MRVGKIVRIAAILRSEPASRSPYRTLETLHSAMQLVAPDELALAAGSLGFAPLSSRRIALRSSKRFMLQTFRLSQATLRMGGAI